MPTQLQNLSQPFTKAELQAVIKGHPLHKALGPDEFCNAYYKTKYDDPVIQLCDSLNTFLATGDIPAESLEAVVVTIYKPAMSPYDPANYRQIFQRNTDPKLYTKLLTPA